MKRVALYVNCDKSHATEVAREVISFFQARGLAVTTRASDAEQLGLEPFSKDVDLCIALGGDGTILRALQDYPPSNPPLLGINLGHLGFLTEVPQSQLHPCLEELLRGEYSVTERMLLEGESSEGRTTLAVNEVVVHRSKNPGLIELALFVDDQYVNTFAADGVILATPSGSTAYSLAAGGPILAPELEAMVVTPVSPHTISHRPIVLMPRHHMRVEYLGKQFEAEVSCDGVSFSMLERGQRFEVRRARRTLRLVSLHRHNYFETLRSKLGWTGQLY